MNKTESTLYSILGITGKSIRPLACAIDLAGNLMFSQRIPMDDIHVTTDIYQEVAKRLHGGGDSQSSVKATARQIQALSNLCWDTLVDRKLVDHYLGMSLKDIRAPRNLIFYLAFYIYLDTPFFDAIEQKPELLF